MSVPAASLLQCRTSDGDYSTILSATKKENKMKVELIREPARDLLIVIDGLTAVSCGPRVEDDEHNCRPPVNGEDPEFYSVFVHDEKGEAEVIADVATFPEALTLLRHVVGAWVVERAVKTGLNDAVAMERVIDEVTMLTSMSAMGLST